MKHILSTLVLAALLSGCSSDIAGPDEPPSPASSDALRGSWPANKAEKGKAVARPIQGHLEGTVSRTRLSETELLFRLENTATGVVSHFGRSRADWAVPQMRVLPGRREVEVLSGGWTGTITAANGDKVFGRYVFRESTIPFSLLGGFEATADLVITGGTGRFEGITGTAVTVVSGNVYTEKFRTDFKGVVF